MPLPTRPPQNCNPASLLNCSPLELKTQSILSIAVTILGAGNVADLYA